jgi:hypothetical protein
MKNELEKKHAKVIQVISTSITKDEKGIKDLLKRNGVNTSFIKSKKELSNVFLNALAKSKGLGLDFHKYIIDKLNKEGYNSANGYSYADGMFDYKKDDSLYDFTNITVGGGYDNTTLDPVTEKTELEKESRFFDGLNFMELLNMGMGVLEIQRDMSVSSDNQKSVEDAVNSQNTKNNSESKEDDKSNMTTYIVIGTVGVALIGTAIWFIMKKKK